MHRDIHFCFKVTHLHGGLHLALQLHWASTGSPADKTGFVWKIGVHSFCSRRHPQSPGDGRSMSFMKDLPQISPLCNWNIQIIIHNAYCRYGLFWCNCFYLVYLAFVKYDILKVYEILYRKSNVYEEKYNWYVALWKCTWWRVSLLGGMLSKFLPLCRRYNLASSTDLMSRSRTPYKRTTNSLMVGMARSTSSFDAVFEDSVIRSSVRSGRVSQVFHGPLLPCP